MMNIWANVMEAIGSFSQLTEITLMAVILLVVVLVTGVLHVFKQPTLIGYLLAGILLGPIALNIIGDTHMPEDSSFIELFSSLGIALLLFLVGLDLSVGTIKEHGKIALIVGLAQIILTAGAGFLLCRFLGFDTWTSGYISLALAFSSTIIIIKLLTDKREAEGLYGKITISILIIQDLVVMVSLMVLSISGNAGAAGTELMIVESILLLIVFVAISLRVLPRVMNWFAASQEYLLLIGMCRCLLIGGMFLRVGFSFEIGCLLAGMSLSMSPYRQEMAHRLRSLRDFFIVLFFINIGLQLEFDNIGQHIGTILLLTLFVIAIKPLLVYIVMRLFRYTNNTSLKTAFCLGQLSEFSFLLMGMGVTLGHITDPVAETIVMCVGLISIFFSSYSIVFNEQLYKLSKRFLGEHDRVAESDERSGQRFEVILFGYGRMGAVISEVLEKNEISHVIIDHNPKIHRDLRHSHKAHIYADATNREVYQEYFSRGVRMIISTIVDFDDNREIVKVAKSEDPGAVVIVVSNDTDKALMLYDAGADYVIMPSHLSAHHMSLMIEEAQFDIEKILNHKKEHLERIRTAT